MSIINANELLEGLSLSLDVAENKTFEHAQRTAYIALRIARELTLPEEEIQDIFVASLLHDIGMTTSIADPHQDVSLLVAHCQVGAQMIEPLPFSANVMDYIRWHHANWDGSGPFERQGDSIPIGSQIIYLADQLDVLLQELGSIYSDRSEIRKKINKRSGVHFSPLLVEAFYAVQSNEIFWLEYSSSYLSEILRSIRPNINCAIDSSHFVAVSDVYQALTEERPYRNPLPESQVIEILQGMVKDHKLSPEVFSSLSLVL